MTHRLFPAFLLALALPGGSQTSGLKSATPQPAISLTFVQSSQGPSLRAAGGEGAIDLGNVSYFAGARTPGANFSRTAGSIHLSSAVAIRVDATANAQGTAAISAYLLASDDHQDWRLDGQRLSFQPHLLRARVPYGTVAEFSLEIEIPKEAVGQISNRIGFTATAN